MVVGSSVVVGLLLLSDGATFVFVWVELLVVIDGDIDDKTNQPIAPAIKIAIITAKVTISDLFFMNILYQASQLIDTIAGQPGYYKA